MFEWGMDSRFRGNDGYICNKLHIYNAGFSYMQLFAYTHVMSLKHAILVLLEQEPGSGYDLVQRFNKGIGNFWQASHQQVYQQLKKLDAEKLVSFRTEKQSGKPDRKVYRITAAGLKELKHWLAREDDPPVVRDALLIKLFAGHLTDRGALLAELARHRALHRDKLAGHLQLEEKYRQQPQARQQAQLLPYLTLRRGIRYEQEWIDWVDEVEAVLV